ncbi:TonB-dependent receptor plug domain-containing protein [Reichenbachiella versicolor]|uniref:TonB-dependent receptor plug domain-containing protein n=1 Tax=Reichenbachiella versicolor TaxID=1821036 RepID=UPI000D6E3BAD|nr:TonB-dependent receptor [Reichenbachiella versicolor]
MIKKVSTSIIFSVLSHAVLFAQVKTDVDSLDIENWSLQEILDFRIYSVTKQEEKLAEVPLSAYKLTHEEINRWGTRYLFETMGRVSGYSFYNTDYYGQHGFMVRGLQSIWRYGYSIELMPIQDYGHTLFPHEFFSSVEAARGPSGLAWGSSANAGLMNLNIRDDLNGPELVGSYGNYNQFSLSALYGRKFEDDKGGMFFGVNEKGQNPETVEDAFNQPGNNWKVNGLLPSYSFIGKVEYEGFKAIVYMEKNDHVSPQLWFEDAYDRRPDGQWRPNQFAQLWKDIADSTGADPHDQLDVWSYRLEYTLPLKGDNIDVSLYHNHYEKTWYMNAVGIDGQSTRDVGFNANARALDNKLNISFGSDLYGLAKNQLYSINDQFAIRRGVDWFGKTSAPTNIRYHNSFVQLDYNILPELRVIGGTRFDFQDDGMFQDWMVFYRGGLIYMRNENLVFKYFYNNAPRRPQANERGHTSPDEEILSAHEVAVIGNLGEVFNFNVNLYYQQLENQITRDNSSFNDFINTGGMKTLGIEWGIKSRPINKLLLYWNGSTMRSKINAGQLAINPGNSEGRPLFVPSFNSFLGAEYQILDLLRTNMAWRAVYGIPYHDQQHEEQIASANFFDLTMTSRKFWKKLEVSFVALNLFNNTKPLPAYGEHAKNQPGTIAPEGLRYYLKTRYTF